METGMSFDHLYGEGSVADVHIQSIAMSRGTYWSEADWFLGGSNPKMRPLVLAIGSGDASATGGM
jgi:hypothetical protein